MEFLKLLSNLRNPVLDQLMLIISDIGTPVFAFGLITWFYLNISKKDAYQMSIGFYFSLLLAQGAKLIFRVPRPWLLDSDFHASKRALSTATGYSFPSVHTQSTESIGTSILMTRKNRILRRITIAMMILVPFSRMWLGCHTPKDVCVGFLLGSVVTFFLGRLWNAHEGKLNGVLVIFLLALSGILLLIGFFLTGNGTIDFLLAKDSFKSVGLAIGFSAGYFLERNFIHFRTEGTKLQYLQRFIIACGGMILIELIGRSISNTVAVLVTIRYILIGFYLTFITPCLCVRLNLIRVQTGA
jgi:membrane-associated phospholipid phosphatase